MESAFRNRLLVSRERFLARMAAKALEVALSFHALCEGLAVFEARGRFPLLRGQDPVSMWRSALAALVAGYREP